MRYELFYLISASKEAETEKVKADLRKIVEEAGGVFEEKETQEKRKLAYKIKHETHGIYIAQRFELSEPENLGEVNKKLNLYPGILRFMVSKAAELPELRSKEERINEANQRDSKTRENERRAEEKQRPAKKAAAPAKAKKDESVSSDDIDKKLEEILNI